MQRPATPGWIVITTLAVACGGGQKQPAPSAPVAEPTQAVEPSTPDDGDEPLPAIPGSPQPAPATLVATVEAANPAAVWAALGTYADSVSPGAGAPFTVDFLAQGASEMLQLTRTDAIDMTQPFRLLVLDPQAVPDPFVAVVHAADEQALRDAARQGGRAVLAHDGVFAVGSRQALVEGAPFALTTFHSAPAPDSPRLTVYVRSLMERYRQQVDMVAGMARQQLSAMTGPEGELYAAILEGALALAGQIEMATATLEVDPASATGTLALTPIAGTGLAGFIAAQQPSPFALLDMLPSHPVAFAGRLELAPIRDTINELLRLTMEMTVGSSLGDVMGQFWKFYEYVEGEMSGTMSMAMAGAGKPPKFSFTALANTTKPAELRKTLAAYYQDIAKASRKEGKLVYKYRPRGFTHRCVKLDEVTMKLGPNATDKERTMLSMFGGAQVSYSGVDGGRMLTASGTDAKAAARALIDATKAKKREVPAWLRATADDARGRKESILLALDGASLGAALTGGKSGKTAAPGPGAAMAIGFDGGAMSWRLSVPAAQVAQFQQMGQAMGGAPPVMAPTP